MDLTYTGRGLQVTDEMRDAAAHKLGRLERMEPRAVRLDLEIINEHHPAPDALKRIEAALHTPRKTFATTTANAGPCCTVGTGA